MIRDVPMGLSDQSFNMRAAFDASIIACGAHKYYYSANRSTETRYENVTGNEERESYRRACDMAQIESLTILCGTCELIQ